jgi:hypothetical protein
MGEQQANILLLACCTGIKKASPFQRVPVTAVSDG